MKVYVALAMMNRKDPYKINMKVFASQNDAENFADNPPDECYWHVFEKEVEGVDKIFLYRELIKNPIGNKEVENFHHRCKDKDINERINGFCGGEEITIDEKFNQIKGLLIDKMNDSDCNIPIEARHSMPKGSGGLIFVQNGKQVEKFTGEKNDK